MTIKELTESDYLKYTEKNELHSFYQSPEWKKVKENEGKKCEYLGLFEDDKLVGASLIVYLKVLRKYYIAYASRGFLYDYSKLEDFKSSIKEYFNKKNVIMFKMDPPVILATYDTHLNKTQNDNNYKLINDLINSGFKHFGFNMANEAYQFRFVHRITLEKSFDKQQELMSKSTRKNIEIAKFKGVYIKKATKEELDDVMKCFEYTEYRKKFRGFSKKFYESLIDTFKDNCKLYLVYVNKDVYLNNIKNKINEIINEQQELDKQMKKVHVGNKLLTKQRQLESSLHKYEDELFKNENLDFNKPIASMITITKYDEVVSLSSGMDDEYREFCPKYIMYPEMIKEAINEKLKFVNFLGVKNIFDPKDANHGVYEVKKGFGGETLEYIGEFDLPINNVLYNVYKLINKIKK